MAIAIKENGNRLPVDGLIGSRGSGHFTSAIDPLTMAGESQISMMASQLFRHPYSSTAPDLEMRVTSWPCFRAPPIALSLMYLASLVLILVILHKKEMTVAISCRPSTHGRPRCLPRERQCGDDRGFHCDYSATCGQSYATSDLAGSHLLLLETSPLPPSSAMGIPQSFS